MSDDKKHSGQYSEVVEYLSDKLVSELPEQAQVLEIDGDNCSLLEAFQLIVGKGFLSAPVYTINHKTKKKQYCGFLDTRNLVAWVVFAYDEKNITPSLQEIVHHGIKRVDVAIDGVTVNYLARSHPLKPVAADDKILHAMSVLSARGCHRVPVLDAEGNIKKLITQYSMIEYLYKHRASYAHVFAKTIGALELGKSPVIAVQNSVLTIEAFQQMERSNLSGIAVLNDDGQIIGATSGADLKLFLQFSVRASLDLTIMQFLNMIRQESLRATVPVLVCEETSTLGAVIAKLAATREHRIFVIDSSKSFKPIKVISLSDVLAAIVAEDPQ